jgi:mannose-6-phosphate isomerase-like protein (cupin superfamily)
MPTRPIVLSPEDRPRSLNVLGEQITVLAAADQTGGPEIFFPSGPVGSGPPPHHHGWDEAFYVLRGDVTFVVGDESRLAGPGSCVYVPGGTLHLFEMGPGGAEMLSITSAPGASGMFTAIDQAVAAGDTDLAAVVAVVTAHGATVALPADTVDA